MKRFFAVLAIAALFSSQAFAQQKSPEEREKELFESIDKQVEKFTTQLKLEDWQIFKADSTLTHDYMALTAELNQLSMAKVSNYDLYMRVQDKWSENIYQSFKNFLNPEQFAKYEKNGAGKEKKMRDTRAAKIAGTDSKTKKKK